MTAENFKLEDITMGVAIISDPICLEHQTGNHPENPGRLMAIMSLLHQSKVLARLARIAARAAKADELRLVHLAHYVEYIKSVALRRGLHGPRYGHLRRLVRCGALRSRNELLCFPPFRLCSLANKPTRSDDPTGGQF